MRRRLKILVVTVCSSSEPDSTLKCCRGRVIITPTGVERERAVKQRVSCDICLVVIDVLRLHG